ncbi:hypothetical protein DCO48_00840 [Pseudomonas sp. SDI]|uniref:LPS O-antigen chain length determinant protein WzzB n=1 Tax=Pseudomonas sp. SDI TaxID=2170734 RepID=UPI000DE620BC|nr:Wzz/FepE/Etk N-terminal domain-containing protein [Pseudomonas sp. SDI]PWB36025.1 hypothetical protein DCO48_00840 [Pseudomonas sp. SDI]
MSNNRERESAGHENELIELIRMLWGGKWVIASVAALVLIAAIFYAFSVTPLYEAKMFVEPPAQNDIAPLNFGRGADTELPLLSTEDVYDVYARSLLSESLRRKFFQTVYLPGLDEAQRRQGQDGLYSQFNQLLLVARVNKDVPTRYSIKVQLADPREAVQWVVQYAEMVSAQAKVEVLNGAKSDAAVKAANLERQIAMARNTAEKVREDREARLSEALAVAKSIGLEKPPLISGSLAAEISAGVAGALSYMRGSQALQAEIDNLQSRASDDPFIEGLRQLEEDFAFYRGLSIDPSVVAVYRQDGAVELPDRPVRPNKLLIVLMGGLLGVVMGILVVLVRSLLRGISVRRNH